MSRTLHSQPFKGIGLNLTGPNEYMTFPCSNVLYNPKFQPVEIGHVLNVASSTTSEVVFRQTFPSAWSRVFYNDLTVYFPTLGEVVSGQLSPTQNSIILNKPISKTVPWMSPFIIRGQWQRADVVDGDVGYELKLGPGQAYTRILDNAAGPSPSLNMQDWYAAAEFHRGGLLWCSVVRGDRLIAEGQISEVKTLPFNEPPIVESPSPLRIYFTNKGSEPVYITNVYLGPSYGRGHHFSTKYMERLLDLAPPVLRAWQDHSGSSWANLISPNPAPVHWRWQAKTLFGEMLYSYSSFVELCHTCDIEPWIIIPTTLLPSEWPLLKQTLLEWSSLHSLKVEFGNEAWGSNHANDPFMGGSAGDHYYYQQLFQPLIDYLKPLPNVEFIINGQAKNPSSSNYMVDIVKGEGAQAIAPYYGNLSTEASDWEKIYRAEITRSREIVKEFYRFKTPKLHIYETQLHTTGSPFGPEPCNELIMRPESVGFFMATLLDQCLSIEGDTCVYCFDKYQHGAVKLWGVIEQPRDKGLLRPLGVAIEALNQFIPLGAPLTLYYEHSKFPVEAVNGCPEGHERGKILEYVFSLETNDSVVVWINTTKTLITTPYLIPDPNQDQWSSVLCGPNVPLQPFEARITKYNPTYQPPPSLKRYLLGSDGSFESIVDEPSLDDIVSIIYQKKGGA